MQHAMQTIAQYGMQPAGKVDRESHFIAHRLLAVFVNDESEAARIDTVRSMAIGEARITAQQLDDELTTAAKLADEADKLAGFKPAEGAKGQDKYGPKRASLNSIASQIRQLWGAMVHCNACGGVSDDGEMIAPKIPEGMGFVRAVGVARTMLKAQGIKWDGTEKPSEELQAIADASIALQRAKVQAAKLAPQKAGETIADFQTRIDAEAEKILAKDASDKRESQIAKAVKGLIESLGLEDAAEVAARITAQWEEKALEGMAKAEGQGDGVTQ